MPEQANPNPSTEAEPDSPGRLLSPQDIGSSIVNAVLDFPPDSKCRTELERLIKSTPGGRAYEIAKNTLFGDK